MFNLFKQLDLFKIGSSGTVAYNPLINYDWSTTTTSGLRYLKDVGSTPTYNASMYFGRGAYFNGVDQHISINTISLTGDYTISFISNTDGLNQKILFGTNVGIANFIRFEGTSITYRVNNIEYSFPFLDSANTIASYVFKRVGTLTTLYINGVSIVSKTIPTSTIIFNKVGTSAGIQYFKGTLKDVYMFNRALNQSEITQAYEQPEAFYAMAKADSNCVLNMPMCETSSTARNYKTGIDHSITNYTSSVRDNAKNLQYGLQTCKFARDNLGVIQSASDYLECDGTGYATIPSHTNKVNIKMTVNPTSLSGNLLSIGVTKTLTGLTLNVDNDVVINDITPTGAITLASGFTGTIKSYMEETR